MQETKQMGRQDEQGYIKATFRFPAEMLKDLKHMAIDREVPVNTLMVQAVKALLAKESKR
jgi:hypothetical protein